MGEVSGKSVYVDSGECCSLDAIESCVVDVAPLRFDVLADIILRLGRVSRLTEDQFGNAESDTTHTVMLALAAGEVAHMAEMDVGRVLGLALIHDIAETFAGDTPTLLPLTEEQKRHKENRESEAIAALRVKLVSMPWIVGLIDEYEAQQTHESRFVRIMDKVAPKWTHLLNGCAVPRRVGMSPHELDQRHHAQIKELAGTYPDQTIALHLLEDACVQSVAAWRE